jgi:hypothetical protein
VPRPVPSLAPLAGCAELRFLIVPPPADGDLRCLLDLPALQHVVIRGSLTRVDESVLDELRRRGLYVSVDRERRPPRDVSPW